MLKDTNIHGPIKRGMAQIFQKKCNNLIDNLDKKGNIRKLRLST